MNKVNCYVKIIVVLLTIMFSTATITSWADADGPDYWKVQHVKPDDVLNIREKPNWKAKKVGAIPPNSGCLTNIECVGGLTFEEFTTLSAEEQETIEKQKPRWCRVKYENITGWVSAKYLIEDSENQCSE